MNRGPNGQVGDHTGLLDFKCFAKIASGVLLLRMGNSPSWTKDIDSGFVLWLQNYLGWLESHPVPQQERHFPKFVFAVLEIDGHLELTVGFSNHGSYFYNQWAALKILVGDMDGAKNVAQEYFATLYQKQVTANGDQVSLPFAFIIDSKSTNQSVTA